MARRKGFVPNRRNIGRILREDAGIGAALDAVAEPAAAKAGGEVRKYVTDRQARAIVVGAEAQAIDGAATKAMAEVQAFASKREWRASFARGDSDASARAHATSGGYRGLPERSRK